MNQEQAKAWLPLIQAVAEGKTMQSSSIEHDDGTFKKVWRDFNLPLQLDGIDPKCFRIKPEPKKQSYRTYLMKYGAGIYAVEVVNKKENEPQIQANSAFVGWLTDRIEYELPEDQA